MRHFIFALLAAMVTVTAGLNSALAAKLFPSRRAAIAGMASVLLPVAPHAARADGSKTDKSFTECLSKCLYEKTKITKGIGQVEVVSRADAMLECKPKCATSKAQLLIGQPKK